MACVDFKVLLGVAFWASINYTFFGGCQVHRWLTFEELKRQAAGKSEIHVVNILFLVVLRKSAEEHEVITLEAFFHGPLSDSAVGTDRYQGFALAALAFGDPLNIPDSIGVFVEGLTIFGDGNVRLFANIVDGDCTVLGATSYKIWVFDTKLAGGKGELTGEYFLGEGRVFQGPEHE
jgi:hypothetical protein